MNHINDDDAAAFLINDAEPGDQVLWCDECVADLNRTRSHLDAVRDYVAVAAERDEFFWTQQRAAIRQRINPAARGVRLRWAACVAGLVAIAALLVGSSGTPSHETVRNAQLDPDYVLLADIQQTLARPVPNAVEPMRVLASDMDQAWRAHLQKIQDQDPRSGERE